MYYQQACMLQSLKKAPSSLASYNGLHIIPFLITRLSELCYTRQGVSGKVQQIHSAGDWEMREM